jgi:hypothetical protein
MIQPQQWRSLLGTIAHVRPAGIESTIILDRTGPGKKDPLARGGRLVQRPRAQVVQPVDQGDASLFEDSGDPEDRRRVS